MAPECWLCAERRVALSDMFQLVTVGEEFLQGHWGGGEGV